MRRETVSDGLMNSCLLVQVDGLYLMMGRGLDRLHQVPAGNVIAIGGLGTAILKSATITSSPACRPLAPMLFQVTHSLPHSCTHSLTCLLASLLNHSFAHSLNHSFAHSLAQSFARSLTHSLPHSLTHSLNCTHSTALLQLPSLNCNADTALLTPHC